MKLQERENDDTHYNLDGSIKSRFPLTVTAMPVLEKRTNCFSELFSGDGQDAESKLGRHDLAVERALEGKRVRSRDGPFRKNRKGQVTILGRRARSVS